MALSTLYRSGILLARGLATFGVWLHDAGFPRYILVHAILGVQSAQPHWRAFLTEAWDVAKQRGLAEPAKLRLPLPRALLRAMVAVCLTWDWPVMAALLLMGSPCSCGLVNCSRLAVATCRSLATGLSRLATPF